MSLQVIELVPRDALRAALPDVAIDVLLGSGAGGCVVAGTHRPTGAAVAIKVLAGERFRDPVARERLENEARVLMACRHPHVIRALEFLPLDDMSILVLERVDAESVLERNARDRVELAEALQVLAATAEALQHVHDRGYLHGDVKPEHVLFDRAGQHRLIDFGLARPWPFAVHRQVAGTPWYMPPEAIRAGDHLVPASDVYALGMLAYELLAGHLPFPPAAGAIDIMRQQLEVAPMPLEVAAPSLPRALSRLVMQALEKSVERRVPTAREFAERLHAGAPHAAAARA